VAIGAAVSDGHRSFTRLAVSSGKRDGVTPCGMCRQTLAEFCDGEFPIVTDGEDRDGPTEYTLGELLPTTITREHLDR